MQRSAVFNDDVFWEATGRRREAFATVSGAAQCFNEDVLQECHKQKKEGFCHRGSGAAQRASFLFIFVGDRLCRC